MSNHTPTIEFYFDFASPYSYFGFVLLLKLQGEITFHIKLNPVSLYGILKKSGNPSPATSLIKAYYLKTDLDKLASFYEIPFSFNPEFPINSKHALIVFSEMMNELETDKQTELADKMFKAVWVNNQNIANPDLLTSIAQNYTPSIDISKIIRNPDKIKKLREATNTAVQLGLFGLPFFKFQGQLFWGQDRLMLLKNALKSAPS